VTNWKIISDTRNSKFTKVFDVEKTANAALTSAIGGSRKKPVVKLKVPPPKTCEIDALTKSNVAKKKVGSMRLTATFTSSQSFQF
jgi:hypothetical protein